MSFRNTIILAVIVAIFGAYLYYVEKPAAEKEARQGKLVDVAREQIVKLELESAKGKFQLEKSGADWKIVAPRQMAADAGTIEAVLGTVTEAEVKKTVDEKPADLAPFGLDKPEAVVVVGLEGGRSEKLSVGKKTPIGASAYVRRGDETAVLLTGDVVRAGLQKDLNDLRDKSVLAFSDADVKEITVRGVESEPTVLRKDGNDWTLVSPIAAKADAAQVRSLLASLRSLRATAFFDDAGTPPDAKYQLAPPRVAVDLVLGPDGATKTLLVGGATEEPAKKEIYAQSLPGDTVITVGSHLFSMVGKRTSDFRDKTVLAFDKDKLRSVVVERSAGDGFTLQKNGEAWTVADAGDTGVKEFVASRFVDDVRDLKGAEIASETGPRPEFGLDQPMTTIKLVGTDGDLGTIRVAQVGEGADRRLYVAADGSQSVFVLQDYVFQRVDKKRTDFLTLPTPVPGASPSDADDAGVDDAADDDGAAEEPGDETAPSAP